MNKIIEAIRRYNSISEPVKASIWFVFSNILLKGISFFTLPIFSRILTTEEYGVVSVYQSWVGFFTIITSLTLWGAVFNVGMVKFYDKKDEMMSAFQGLSTTIVIIYMIISVLYIDKMSSLLGISRLLVVCMYLEILAQIPFNFWSSYQRYVYKYKNLILITVVTSILNPLLGYLTIVNTQFKAEARIISGLVINLILGIILFIINQIRGKKFYNSCFWKYAFSSGIVLIPHYLSMQVLNQSDRIMISNMCGKSNAGIYGVAYNFAMVLGLVTNGFNASLTPYIYQSLKENRTENLTKRTGGVVLVVAIISLAIICAVPEIFKFLLPASYYASLYVIPPVTIGAYFMFIYPLFSTVEMYYGEKKFVTLGSVIAALTNIFLNYIFIKKFGFIAAAYTTLVCYLLLSVVHYFFMLNINRKKGVKNTVYDIKIISIISIVVIILGILMTIVYEYTILRWSVILFVIIIVYIKKKWFRWIFEDVLNKG